MTQSGKILGPVEFRSGDGPKMPIPRGQFDVVTSQTDATLSWTDGKTHGSAAMPLSEFKKYVSDGDIKLDQ
jgi:hypothetical protein